MNFSFFAVLNDGRHIVWTYTANDEATGMALLHEEIAKQVGPHVDVLDRFVFACGSSSQQYTPGEVKEVFVDKAPRHRYR